MSLIFLSCALFGLGLYGILVRRDIVAVLASIEVMLGGALVLLVGFGSAARFIRPALATTAASPVEGVALMVVVIAAAEAAVGLALLVAIARRRGVARMDELTEVKG